MNGSCIVHRVPMVFDFQGDAVFKKYQMKSTECLANGWEVFCEKVSPKRRIIFAKSFTRHMGDGSKAGQHADHHKQGWKGTIVSFPMKSKKPTSSIASKLHVQNV